ncbi:uncharacterized protein K441DRAFT_697738 [Cenococcum geophilum 1.58]|uniref:uncharacterized protein n=1 Tax=Cenococcum geophilum 1.58 TaxID=794803 RepID=UPI00358E6063|nr:hypothetical protein K441DRAFT_697738 [Cenococcum geophilum 1.58]
MPPKNLFPALCASIVCLLASPSSSVVLPAGIALSANHAVTKAVAQRDQAVRQTDLDVAHKADDCYVWVRVRASPVCCPASLPHCTSESSFGTGCFAASTTMPTTTSPQWNELNTTKTSTSTSQPPDIIATIQSTIYVTKTVISHSSSVSSSMGNSAIATPDNSAPDSVNSAAKATLYKTSTITLVSGIVIITSEPATILTPNNEPSEVQLQAAATSSVASMDKGLLPTTEYDPLDCSWFYFCTNFATTSGTLTRVTCLCSSLYITHVTTQAITNSGPSTVYTTTTAYTTATPTSYTTETPIVSAQLDPSVSTVTPASTSTSTSTSTSASTPISTTTEYLSITHHRMVTVTQTYATNNSVLYVETGFSPLDTGNVLAPLRTGQALAPRAAERVATVTTTVTSIVTTITVTTTEVVEETEIPSTTVKSTLPLPSNSILTSQSLTASTSQNLSKTASSGTSELPASTIASMSLLQSSSSSIMSMLNSVVSATSLLSSSGSRMMLSAPSTVMSSAMASNSEIMGTGSTAISSDSILTPSITPPVSLCYDSEHNTNGPCSKTSSTGYYPGASVVPLGSNAFAGQKISCLVVSLVLAIHLALRV